AEKAVPVRSDLLRNINEKENFLNNTIHRMFETFGLKIKSLSSAIKNPKDFIIDAMQRLDDKSSKLDLLISSKINSINDKISFAEKMLESYSFKNVLKRGYAIVWNGIDPITTKDDLQKLSSATVEFANGKVDIFTSAQPQTKPVKKEKKDNKKQTPQNLQGNLF
ncbi:MAG: hypothetical protein IJ638_03755, partial [Alphaproteobacteria bacterium]|nr:hypothetical protein [Alphaproteobacteria bacterium]